MRDESVECVTSVEVDWAGERIVTTERDRVRIRYIGVVESVRVGDVLDTPPTHRARQTFLEWSAFDAPGDVDDDKQKGRVF